MHPGGNWHLLSLWHGTEGHRGETDSSQENDQTYRHNADTYEDGNTLATDVLEDLL